MTKKDLDLASISWTKLKEIRDFFSNMSLDTKRNLYSSGKDSVSLASVFSWPDYFRENNVSKDVAEDVGVFEMNPELNKKVSLWQGDITQLEVDAIVNPAASNLENTGEGENGDIHKGAGDYLQLECKHMNSCELGQSKLSGGYQLPAKWIIHTVGLKEKSQSVLSSCYKTALNLSVQNKLRTIAFPPISTSSGDNSLSQTVHAALRTTRNFLEHDTDNFDRIIFTSKTQEETELYETLLQRYFPLTDVSLRSAL